jgi:hypothetical protein
LLVGRREGKYDDEATLNCLLFVWRMGVPKNTSPPRSDEDRQASFHDCGGSLNNNNGDGDGEEEGVEMSSLIPSSIKNTTRKTKTNAPPSSKGRKAKTQNYICMNDWLGKLVGTLLLGAILAVISNTAFLENGDDDDRSKFSSSDPGLSISSKEEHSTSSNLQDFHCPPPMDLSSGTVKDYLDPGEFEDYLDPDWDLVNFTQTFRDSYFDGWFRTYNKFKTSMTDFKSTYFVPFLKNGDSIYESACGLGLNLLATLEILQEQGNLTNLTVYGNEYLVESVTHASQLLDVLLLSQQHIDPSHKNKVGSICQGDSAELSFVPSNSFDLVFTGYITPHPDPLGMGGDTDEIDHRLKRNCMFLSKTTPGDDDKELSEKFWKASKVRDIMQQHQDEWFSNWFQQLIRIAKPGAPVIVEEVAPPLCHSVSDWGGVSRGFWKQGVDKYGWDVDPSTLRFGSRDRKETSLRYHVFFLKNPAAEKDKLRLPPP